MKRIANIRKRFPLRDTAYSADAVEFIRSVLVQLGINPRLAQKTELLCEESIVMLAQHAAEGAELQVQIRRMFGDVSVQLLMKGEAYDPYYALPEGETEADDFLSEEVIRAILLRSHGEKYK